MGRFLRVLPAAEAGKAHVARAAGAEALPGGDDDLGFPQQMVEEGPAGHALGAGEPQIGGVPPAGEIDPRRPEGLGEDAPVLLIDGDGRPVLLQARRGQGRLPRPL